MARIRNLKELQAQYPEHFRVLQGYWLSGMVTTEQLDRLVERLEKRKPQQPTPKPGSKPAQKPPPAAAEPARRRKKDLSPEKVAYIRRAREKQKLAGPGKAYYDRLRKQSVKVAFRCYGGRNLICTITKDGGDKFTLLADGRRHVVWKTALLYTCKESSLEAVEKAVGLDPAVRAQQLEPVIPEADRYSLPDEELKACVDAQRVLKLTVRGGEILEGRVEWFGAYDIKLELETGRSVVVFRHAVYSHEAGGGE